MSMESRIAQRIATVKDWLGNVESHSAASEGVHTVKKLVQEIDELTALKQTTVEPGGARRHPLGEAPFLNTKILYLLARAEAFLEQPTERRGSPRVRRAVSPARLIFPSVRDSAARRLFAWVLHRRGPQIGRAVAYDQPGPIEALYVKAPKLLEPLVRKWLPGKRKMWNYKPPKR